jgi:hypothetical protein
MVDGWEWLQRNAELSRVEHRLLRNHLAIVLALLNVFDSLLRFLRFFSFFLRCIRTSFFLPFFHLISTEYMYVCTLYTHVIS